MHKTENLVSRFVFLSLCASLAFLILFARSVKIQSKCTEQGKCKTWGSGICFCFASLHF